MSAPDRLLRASRAGIELPQTEAAFADLRAALVERWASTTVDQVATREKMFFALQTLDSVRKALIRTATDGAVLKHSAEVAELLKPADQDRRL